MEKETILLVEDNEFDVQLMRLAVRNADSPFFLVHVCDGQKAIQYLSRTGKYADKNLYPDPALVVLDLAMPLVNGFEVLRWMSEQQASLPPAVVLSYSLMERDRRLAYELGAEMFVPKPPDLEGTVALVKSLATFCKKSVARQSAECL